MVAAGVLLLPGTAAVSAQDLLAQQARPVVFRLPENPFDSLVPMKKSYDEVSADPDNLDPSQESPAGPQEPSMRDIFATGDWGGKRKEWAEKGLDFDLHWVNFWQGVTGGGTDHDLDYGGKFIAGFTINGTKAGWVKNSIIKVMTETRYLNSPNTDTGSVLPVNVALISPAAKGTVFSITEATWTQLFIRDKGLNIYALSAGRFDTLELFNEPFQGLAGIPKFMHLNMNGPPTAVSTVPLVTNGATFAWLKKGEPFFTFALFDSNDSSLEPGLNRLFADGVTLSPGIILQSHFGGMSGHHSFSGAVTTKETTPFDQLRQVILPTPDNPVVPKRGSWFVDYTMSQYLKQDPKNPKLGWGLFATVSVADNSTNPFRSFFLVGLGGNNLIKSRPQDRFGVAYSYIGLSNALRNALVLLNRLRAQQHQGEIFYNWSIRPWLWLTGDLQFVRGSRPTVSTATVPGVRLEIIF
jgi:porin